jgi:hypothetical protein
MAAWDDYTLTTRDASKSKDLDETRRLLYGALYAGRTKRYELIGTLINALAHHGAGLDPDASGPILLELVEGPWLNAPDAWVRAQIDRVTQLLDN